VSQIVYIESSGVPFPDGIWPEFHMVGLFRDDDYPEDTSHFEPSYIRFSINYIIATTPKNPNFLVTICFELNSLSSVRVAEFYYEGPNLSL